MPELRIPSRIRHGVTLTFAEFAKTHDEHAHCVDCKGCILDTAVHVRHSTPIWCVGCRDRAKDALPAGSPVPWLWESRKSGA